MAAASASSSEFDATDRRVIDLTGLDSDSEGDMSSNGLPLQLRYRSPPRSHMAAMPGSATISPPRSAHGLILPGTFALGRPRSQHGMRQAQRKQQSTGAQTLTPNAIARQNTGILAGIQPQERARLGHGRPVAPKPRFLQEDSSITNHLPSPGNIHKRRRTDGGPPTYPVASPVVLRRQPESKVDQVLRKQVFPYISKALGQYKGDIDSQALKQLGKDVCKELCNNPGFYRDLEDNHGKLSNLYEGQIALESWRLVAQYALALLAKGPTPQVAEPQVHHAVPTTPLSPPVLLDSDNNDDDYSACGRARSTPSPVLDESNAARQSSFSPATSISASVKQKDELESDVEITPYSNHKSQVRFPIAIYRQRVTTRSRGPLRISKSQPSKAIRRPHRAVSRPQLSAPSTSSKAIVYHDVNRLRLAGIHLGTPRPFLRKSSREDIARGFNILGKMKKSHRGFSDAYKVLLERLTLHVDFCQEELMYVAQAISADEDKHTILPKNCRERIVHRLQRRSEDISDIKATLLASSETDDVGCKLVRSRGDGAIQAFLEDAAAGIICDAVQSTRLQFRYPQHQAAFKPLDCINSILLSRSIGGNARQAAGRNHKSFRNRLTTAFEDTLSYRTQWSDCSGDLATFAWTPGNGLVCGAVAHLDDHNMQYNKPGNLLIGSVLSRELVSLPEHRVARPVVYKGENALQSMRRTQDPFLYCSVTSVAYSQHYNKCFTGGFDNTVKIWNVDTLQSPKMELCGTWQHEGHVNFVVSSPHHDLIATASDVGQNAVRVYTLDRDNISCSPFATYSGERADELAHARRSSNVNWAYHPATMQWGKSATVSHLLLVGYSPRSYDCQDADIPEDKVNTGELSLWDTRSGTKVVITTARTQNVFEVIWHPTQPIFVAATSPIGEFEDHVRTQLRLFVQTPSGSFSHIKTLDCTALDINEITLMPNSEVNSFVTASCTDGNTYVWDTAYGERPIHVLAHGRAIDELDSDVPDETGDVGVKFAAWGRTTERFYTGSSDGVVKAWNLCMPRGKEHLHDVITLSGGVSAGTWSPDFTKLVIGDSTGKVHLLSVDDETSVGEVHRQPITQHNPPPLEAVDGHIQDICDHTEQTARQIAQEFLLRRQIVLHPDPYVGAIQGPEYSSTNLFRMDAHKDSDPTKKALRSTRVEQMSRYHYRSLILPRLPQLTSSSPSSLHEQNIQQDLDFESLPIETREEAVQDGLDFNFDDDFDLEEEDSIRLLLRSLSGTRDITKGYDGSAAEESPRLHIDAEEDLQKLTAVLDKEIGLLKGFRTVLEAVYS